MRGTVPQKTDRRSGREVGPVRVKRRCKRPPAPGVTRVARQTPPGARPNRGRWRAARPSPRVGRRRPSVTAVVDGWSPMAPAGAGTGSGLQADSPACMPLPGVPDGIERRSVPTKDFEAILDLATASSPTRPDTSGIRTPWPPLTVAGCWDSVAWVRPRPPTTRIGLTCLVDDCGVADPDVRRPSPTALLRAIGTRAAETWGGPAGCDQGSPRCAEANRAGSRRPGHGLRMVGGPDPGVTLGECASRS